MTRADQEHALQVDPQHGIEIGLADLQEVGGLDDAGVVDQDVEATERRERPIDQALCLAGIADVGLDELHPTAVCPDRLGRALAAFGIDVADDHGSGFGGEGLDAGMADAVRTAGHDHHLIRKAHFALPPRSLRHP
jgi:hypothetical protein